jgi:C4-dicarboxylate transporter DctM subunit
MSLLSVPDMIGDALSDVTQSPFLLLMIIAVILIITGMFLESIAQIILLTPLLLPIVVALGIDPIVFGIVMVISCEVGFLTPPVGANLFVAARITNLGIDKISVAVLPFLLAYIAVLVFVSLFPDVVTWLPNLVYGKYGG